MPKQIYKIGLIFSLVILAVGLFIVQRTNKTDAPSPAPTPIAVSKLPLDPVETKSQIIDYSVSLPSPTSVPKTYIFTTSNNYIGINDLPDSFGFQTNNYDQPTNTWFSPTIGRMGIDQTIGYAYFQPPQPQSPPSSPATSLETTDEIAKKILNQYKLISENTALMVTEGQFLQSNGYNIVTNNSAQKANQTKLNYSYVFEQLPLFLSIRPLASITVTINSDKTLSALTYYQLPEIVEKTPVTPISLESAIELLSNNQGTLISATSNKQTESEIEINYSKASIKRSNLIYLNIPEQNRIIPVYQFIGTAPSKDSKLVYNVSYIVPAVK